MAKEQDADVDADAHGFATDERHRAKTPPAGLPPPARLTRPSPRVIQSTASIGPADTWENSRTGVDSESEHVGESPLQTVVRRSADTKNNTIDTLAMVDALRRETSDHIGKLDEKFDALVGVVGDVRVEVAETRGQNTVIIEMLSEQAKSRERSGLMRLSGFTAQIEVDKATKLTGLEQQAKWGEFWRRNLGKVIAAVIAGTGAIGGAYLIGRGG